MSIIRSHITSKGTPLANPLRHTAVTVHLSLVSLFRCRRRTKRFITINRILALILDLLANEALRLALQEVAEAILRKRAVPGQV